MSVVTTESVFHKVIFTEKESVSCFSNLLMFLPFPLFIFIFFRFYLMVLFDKTDFMWLIPPWRLRILVMMWVLI